MWKINIYCVWDVYSFSLFWEGIHKIIEYYDYSSDTFKVRGGGGKVFLFQKNLLKMSKPQKCNFILFIFISSWNNETEWTISTSEGNFCIHYSLTHLNCFSFELWRREKNWFGWILYLLTLCWHIFKVQFFPNCNFSFVRRS